ncbi:MAG: DUF4852 domain-containing protein [Proteobacteria bacterium]|nr:DUF4852 domain-containing protein [Pseudomonadota bacterium]
MIFFRGFPFILAAALMLAAVGAAPRAFAQETEMERPEAKSDGYLPTTFQNLSRLYWGIGKFAPDDIDAVNRYLLINECEMYQQYYYNDFEWSKILETTRSFLKENSNKFPTRYEVMVPIFLGRYDMDKEEFDLLDKSKVLGTRKIDVIVNGMKKICGVSDNIPGYPRDIIVILSQPLSLTRIPVGRELAQLYLEETSRTFSNLPPHLQMIGYERTAYLRLKVRLMQYKDTTLVNSRDVRAVIFGQLEGIEVYADGNKEKLLYKEDRLKKRLRRVRRYTDPSAGAGAQDQQAEDGNEQGGSGPPDEGVFESFPSGRVAPGGTSGKF